MFGLISCLKTVDPVSPVSPFSPVLPVSPVSLSPLSPCLPCLNFLPCLPCVPCLPFLPHLPRFWSLLIDNCNTVKNNSSRDQFSFLYRIPLCEKTKPMTNDFSSYFPYSAGTAQTTHSPAFCAGFIALHAAWDNLSCNVKKHMPYEICIGVFLLQKSSSDDKDIPKDIQKDVRKTYKKTYN